MLKQILSVIVLLAFAATPAFADFDDGKKAYDAKDWTNAVKQLRPLAEMGDDRAMMLLGNMYASGWGVVPSYKESMSLYRSAAAKNNTQAMDVIGARYVSAIGVDQNLATALQWFLRSASLGDQIGAFYYATLITQGNKNPNNPLQPDLYNGYKWFKIAAGEHAFGKYSTIASKVAHGIAGDRAMTPEQVARADKEVLEWKPVDPNTLGPLPDEPPEKFGPPVPVKLPTPNPKPRITVPEAAAAAHVLAVPPTYVSPPFTPPAIAPTDAGPAMSSSPLLPVLAEPLLHPDQPAK